MARWHWFSVVGVVALIAIGLTAAVAAGDVTTSLTAKKVLIDAKGKETFADADKVKPGDVVEYTVTVKNGTDSAITKLHPNLPIPKGAIYVPGSAKPAEVQASLDGTTYENIPLKRKVKQADGTDKLVPVPVEQYRFLRWSFAKVPAQGSVTATARVTIANATATGSVK
jgi:uncharacterized repeat protein (TIGR01451 family)